jgi:hypothetical protein
MFHGLTETRKVDRSSRCHDSLAIACRDQMLVSRMPYHEARGGVFEVSRRVGTPVHGKRGIHGADVVGSPMRQICCNKSSTLSVERCPMSVACVVRKASADLRPSSRKRVKNAHSALSFEDAPSSVNISLPIR